MIARHATRADYDAPRVTACYMRDLLSFFLVLMASMPRGAQFAQPRRIETSSLLSCICRAAGSGAATRVRMSPAQYAHVFFTSQLRDDIRQRRHHPSALRHAFGGVMSILMPMRGASPRAILFTSRSDPIQSTDARYAAARGVTAAQRCL